MNNSSQHRVCVSVATCDCSKGLVVVVEASAGATLEAVSISAVYVACVTVYDQCLLAAMFSI